MDTFTQSPACPVPLLNQENYHGPIHSVKDATFIIDAAKANLLPRVSATLPPTGRGAPSERALSFASASRRAGLSAGPTGSNGARAESLASFRMYQEIVVVPSAAAGGASSTAVAAGGVVEQQQ